MERGYNFDKFQKKFTMIVGKIAGNRLLLAFRDSFVLVGSVIMIAGFATMINSVFLDPNGIIFGSSGLNLGKIMYGSDKAWQASGFMNNLKYVQSLFSFFVQGAMSINTLLIVVVFAYVISKKFFPKNREHIVSVLYAISAYFICLPWNYTAIINKKNVPLSGIINPNFLGPQGMFAGLLIAGAAVYIYNKLLQKDISIKMPDSVPPAVARSFESLVPGLITLSIFIILTTLSNKFSGLSMPELLLKVLQQPAMAISSTAAFALVSQITWPLFQWFGIHPTSIWGPIFGVTWGIADTENMMGTAHHMYSTLFMNFSTIASGTFALAPVLALLLFSKLKQNKQVSKIALAPAIFNISEPITFGLPIILNPIYFVPFVVVQPLCFYIAVFFTKIGFIPVVTNNVPWTVPPLISGILFTGTFKGALVQLINLVIATLIYLPFVKIADAMELKKEKNKEAK
ncbi:PTS sugar transporter subunit IIC [Clostridium felsineum]|uniref:Permease IIC component n=1 Tax=Clostridium felsineum TaxID=36839 RepID=A0A1S8LMR2_9CLOT|nr:PTS transporter subunit EIIC [Clostridium felsineum]MCR3760886.1 PTS transporter subunit EIIC [Clostridium felsineum]URZ04431.1 PTS system oligo-beta-mannoside-specific EIIC component [Clostridium felsineum]URZ07360.1 PTS system oligo-beta-mannoside-specific EIIC component [Clostridium felsineum]URZ12391.1 PTS system oligo-beta-mannoside-specific EIIC component [Clostridium felsineum]